MSWLIVIVGAVYALVGIGFADLAAAAPSHQGLVIWRLAAWVVSAIVFAGHLWYESWRHHKPPRRAALHVGLAVALGAFGLALAASIHNRRPLALALIIWPIVLGIPAYVAAWIAARGTGRSAGRMRPDDPS